MTATPRLLVRACSALLLAGLLTTTGCSYAKDRLLDLTDVVDVKYGAALGIGAKVEITHFIGAGGGLGVLGYTREWFGRRSFESDGCAFLHLGAIGIDGGAHGCHELDLRGDMSAEGFDASFFLVDVFAMDDFFVTEAERNSNAAGDTTGYTQLPIIDSWRVGFDLLLLPVQLGLYINLGQLADFLVGFSTYDMAGDDGVSKGEVYEWPRDEARRLAAEALMNDGAAEE